MNKNNKGIFITLEGPDGSGKSTIARKLQKYFKDKNRSAVFTREPGGTGIGEQIRNILLDNNNKELSDRTEALLYSAARAQHVDELIKPNLDKGNVVISDRYVLSSLAYQGYARGLGMQEVLDINEFAMNETHPDLILFFEIDPEVSLSRKFINREGDRLENEGNEFHKKTYKGYKKAIESYNKNVYIIDANRSINDVFNQCVKIIERYQKKNLHNFKK